MLTSAVRLDDAPVRSLGVPPFHHILELVEIWHAPAGSSLFIALRPTRKEPDVGIQPVT